MGKQIAQASLNFTGLYESELLLELMLRHWNHPHANDEDFRNDLLELAAEALRASVSGRSLIEGMAPDEMNLVSAIWFAEWNRVSNDREISENERSAVQNWLALVRRAVPGSFCDQQFLE